MEGKKISCHDHLPNPGIGKRIGFDWKPLTGE
jgi:hypothetical protein